MRTIVSFLLMIGVMLAGNLAVAQTGERVVQAQLLVDGGTVEPGEPFWAMIHLTMKDGWHVYWENPGDSGMASLLEWELPEGFTAGPIHWQPPHRMEYSGLVNYGYEGETALLIPVTAPDTVPEGPVTLAVEAEWLVCKEICIPESARLETVFVPGETAVQAAQMIDRYEQSLPKLVAGQGAYVRDKTQVKLTVPSPVESEIKALWWFPLDDGVIANDSEQPWSVKDGQITITGAKGYSEPVDIWRGILKLETDQGISHWHMQAALEAQAAPAVPAVDEKKNHNPITLIGALISAFLGGIILNIMPCVLPILSLKALSIAKKAAHEPAKVRAMGFAYTAGILASFAVIAGGLIALQHAGEAVGWGFQLQSPLFVTVLIYVIFLVGLNLSGVFDLPVLLGSAGSSITSRDDARGTFFTGVLATVVATPCTAPFMATAIGFALSQPPLMALLIFLSLGLGLAFPFLLISLVPALHRLLPRPGNWIIRFRQFLAFPIYATAAWLLWVLVQQSGPMGLALALIGLCLLAFIAWLLPLIKGQILRFILLVITGCILWGTVSGQSFSSAEITEEISADKVPFSMQKLNELRAENTPVFVNATAAWCITCKVNERVALKTESVQRAFNEGGVIFMEADWTNRDTEISDYLASFGRNGVPLYVYYPAQGEPVILPQLLTPKMVTDIINP